jgi:hypothetical protein
MCRQLRHQGDDENALLSEEVSRRESTALDGAQAGENALHADRCVEQYGHSCASNGSREVGAGDDGTVRGSRYRAGVSVRGRARINGLTTSSGTLTDA